ncbi:hypothetical protein Nepgr_007766 [Nepenthes gracilis]|uniref:Uncharacterized protein n=1 Tax=Nepenthes gracilis TaxID=150966 RepID=A0AAD3XIU1_NEPGR|nr:hypothetical protein Nepgr_007766 [Nepenthes gracilis]
MWAPLIECFDSGMSKDSIVNGSFETCPVAGGPSAQGWVERVADLSSSLTPNMKNYYPVPGGNPTANITPAKVALEGAKKWNFTIVS